MSWAQAAGDGADRGTGPQAHRPHPNAAFWDGVWARTACAGYKSDLSLGDVSAGPHCPCPPHLQTEGTDPPLTPFPLVLPHRHPDKNKDPGAEDKFIQISKAYEVTHASCKLLVSLTLSDLSFPYMVWVCVFPVHFCVGKVIDSVEVDITHPENLLSFVDRATGVTSMVSAVNTLLQICPALPKKPQRRKEWVFPKPCPADWRLDCVTYT